MMSKQCKIWFTWRLALQENISKNLEMARGLALVTYDQESLPCKEVLSL